MKFRSFVLCCCMLVVPMLAMFSHLVPVEARLAMRKHLWQPSVACAASLVGQVIGTTPAVAGAVVTPVAAVPPVADRPESTSVTAVSAELPHSTAPPVQPHATASVLPPLPTFPMASTESQPPVSSDASRPPATIAAADRRRSIETNLASLGAVAIRCEPLPGHDGMHVGSCHVAIDASGQLQRVFQAAGADPDTALEHLLDEVMAWRSRTAARQPENALPTRNAAAIRL